MLMMGMEEDMMMELEEAPQREMAMMNFLDSAPQASMMAMGMQFTV